MAEIPIPERCAARPVHQGLVVPYVSLTIDGEVKFGQTHGIRVAECIVNHLCQICGRSLGPKFVFLLAESMLAKRFSGEPALHPECAAYSTQACPMVGGRMRTYARAERDYTGKPCPDPACDCNGWVSDQHTNAGRPAEPWFSAWFTGYAIGIRDAARPLEVGNISGAVLDREPLKVRQITAARQT